MQADLVKSRAGRGHGGTQAPRRTSARRSGWPGQGNGRYGPEVEAMMSLFNAMRAGSSLVAPSGPPVGGWLNDVPVGCREGAVPAVVHGKAAFGIRPSGPFARNDGLSDKKVVRVMKRFQGGSMAVNEAPIEPPSAGDNPSSRARVSPLTLALAGWLDRVDRPGEFWASGTCELPAPGLEVEGVGAVALPLLPFQAEQLIGVAEPAPFGRGAETVIDPSVRRTWQIAATKVAFRGRTWAQTLDGMVRRAADGLGVAGAGTAQLHKLLLYGEGGFFREHRDTEKAGGMFGTLVVMLPSAYDGGELVVRHGGREVTLDLRAQDPAEACFAAFYADCRHEVKPLVSGYRLTLVYNLLRQGSRPEPPAYDDERDGLSALLAAWGEDDPLKLLYPLEHAYTPAALAFDALKGADSARAAVLVAAAERSDCEAHLALLTIRESGSAEHGGGYGRRRRWYEDEAEEDDDFEVVEVSDRSEELSDWRRPDGGDPGLGPLPFAEDELAPPGVLDDLEPTDQSFHETTGNEGASFSRTYHVAALILWPRRHRLAVIAEGGLPATMPALERLVGACRSDRALPEWADAHALAGMMIDSWPTQAWLASEASGAFLDLLTTLGDTERIRSFIDQVVAPGRFEAKDAASVARAIHVLPSAAAADLLARIAAGSAPIEARAAVLPLCADLDIALAAARLVESLPGPTPPTDPWGRRRAVPPSVVIDLVRALAPTDPALLEAAVDTFLAWPTTWDMDAVLVPAVLCLGATSPRLRDACLAHLNSRVALPLAPPADWTRDATLTCGCPQCAGLARFLADPTSETWRLKAPEASRAHVQGTIANSGCDLDTETLRSGRPYSLVCTKNRASYERRVKQRRDDLAVLERL